jgi:hypothetical protein
MNFVKPQVDLPEKFGEREVLAICKRKIEG